MSRASGRSGSDDDDAFQQLLAENGVDDTELMESGDELPFVDATGHRGAAAKVQARPAGMSADNMALFDAMTAFMNTRLKPVENRLANLEKGNRLITTEQSRQSKKLDKQSAAIVDLRKRVFELESAPAQAADRR